MLESSIKDLKSKKFYVALVAEFLGTALLVFVGCGACLPQQMGVNLDKFDQKTQDSKDLTIGFLGSSIVSISLTFGISVATIVWGIAHVSGGHINPAVTAGFLITRKISLIRGVFYVVVQCFGAIVGHGILKALTINMEHPHGLGGTNLQHETTKAQGFAIELIITFVLVFTVFASCDSRRTDLGGSIPLSIGLSVTMCHLFAVPLTGASMNPARSFGPAVLDQGLQESKGLANVWTYHYIYWAGPMLGGIIAALIYDFLFAVNASFAKLRGFFKLNYDDSKYGVKERPSTSDSHAEMKL